MNPTEQKVSILQMKLKSAEDLVKFWKDKYEKLRKKRSGDLEALRIENSNLKMEIFEHRIRRKAEENQNVHKP